MKDYNETCNECPNEEDHNWILIGESININDNQKISDIYECSVCGKRIDDNI